MIVDGVKWGLWLDEDKSEGNMSPTNLIASIRWCSSNIDIMSQTVNPLKHAKICLLAHSKGSVRSCIDW